MKPKKPKHIRVKAPFPTSEEVAEQLGVSRKRLKVARKKVNAKRGAPFKEPKERRTKHLMIRMRADELAELERYCAFVGGMPSTVIRELAFRAIRRKAKH